MKIEAVKTERKNTIALKSEPVQKHRLQHSTCMQKPWPYASSKDKVFGMYAVEIGQNNNERFDYAEKKHLELDGRSDAKTS